jgi:hypothetical protein
LKERLGNTWNPSEVIADRKHDLKRYWMKKGSKEPLFSLAPEVVEDSGSPANKQGKARLRSSPGLLERQVLSD